MRVLIVDNYDSFTWNLAEYVHVLGGECDVLANDEVTPADVESPGLSHVILSPGPGRPERPADFGACPEIIDLCHGRLPLLGVCLGHQGIAWKFGGKVEHAPAPVHGHAGPIRHKGEGLFAGLPKPMTVMRYHSLVVHSDLPPELESTATTEDGVLMAFAHRSAPTFGVQFHPESIGTPEGLDLLRNFLNITP